MIKQTITSEYIVNGNGDSNYNRLSNEMFTTEKKDIYINGAEIPTVCNVLKLGKEISKDIEGSGILVEIKGWFPAFEPNPPFEKINVGVQYEEKSSEPWAINGYIKVFRSITDIANRQFITSNTSQRYISNSIDPDGIPFITNPNGDVGLDLVTARYSNNLGEDVRDVELVMWFGDSFNVEDALETTTPPNPCESWFLVTQYA